ncbi:hypothetical protein JHW43_006732 [Diplocarpon mali]|nr:hypothetical protein JHW43_006732 [Diplocarpon mali]
MSVARDRARPRTRSTNRMLPDIHIPPVSTQSSATATTPLPRHTPTDRGVPTVLALMGVPHGRAVEGEALHGRHCMGGIAWRHCMRGKPSHGRTFVAYGNRDRAAGEHSSACNAGRRQPMHRGPSIPVPERASILAAHSCTTRKPEGGPDHVYTCIAIKLITCSPASQSHRLSDRVSTIHRQLPEAHRSSRVCKPYNAVAVTPDLVRPVPSHPHSSWKAAS